MRTRIIPRGGHRTGSPLLAVPLALLLAGCVPGSSDPGPGSRGEEQEELRSGTAEPEETRGAPYPAVPPRDRDPNEDMKEGVPVPTGPPVGDMQPANPAVEVRPAARDSQPRAAGRMIAYRREAPPPLIFRAYRELPNSISSTSGCCPEVSVAENGQTIMMTGNTWMALSEDGGVNFSNINPTTIFPQSDGGLCCDQVVVYVPRIDMFIWLMQYWTGGDGNNRIRIAAQTTPEVRSSNGTAWTYWDFPSDVFSRDGSLDYNDVAFGESSLWWTSQINGRVVVRLPLSQIAAKGTINYQFTGGTDALWSHLTQNAVNTVYWAGHLSNSQMRVYRMRDGDNFYSWTSVTVSSWPNGTNTSTCPDGSDWMAFEAGKHYVFGNALQGSSVWFSWLAAAGGGFPLPHVQMVRINPATWTRDEQVQIWNRTIAFQDAYLSTNSQGELGMEIAFGSGGFFPSSASGVWGDFVVYYPRLSTRCQPNGRWGDYNHSRRSGATPADWVAAGYTMETNTSGNPIMRPHYVRFGR